MDKCKTSILLFRSLVFGRCSPRIRSSTTGDTQVGREVVRSKTEHPYFFHCHILIRMNHLNILFSSEFNDHTSTRLFAADAR